MILKDEIKVSQPPFNLYNSINLITLFKAEHALSEW